jgi:hypothetical protein
MSTGYEKDTRMTIRAPSQMIQKLRLVCISMSKQQGKLITVSEFIRNLIYPFVKMEKQEDLFKK